MRGRPRGGGALRGLRPPKPSPSARTDAGVQSLQLHSPFFADIHGEAYQSRAPERALRACGGERRACLPLQRWPRLRCPRGVQARSCRLTRRPPPHPAAPCTAGSGGHGSGHLRRLGSRPALVLHLALVAHHAGGLLRGAHRPGPGRPALPGKAGEGEGAPQRKRCRAVGRGLPHRHAGLPALPCRCRQCRLAARAASLLVLPGPHRHSASPRPCWACSCLAWASQCPSACWRPGQVGGRRAAHNICGPVSLAGGRSAPTPARARPRPAPLRRAAGLPTRSLAPPLLPPPPRPHHPIPRLQWRWSRATCTARGWRAGRPAGPTTAAATWLSASPASASTPPTPRSTTGAAGAPRRRCGDARDAARRVFVALQRWRAKGWRPGGGGGAAAGARRGHGLRASAEAGSDHGGFSAGPGSPPHPLPPAGALHLWLLHRRPVLAAGPDHRSGGRRRRQAPPGQQHAPVAAAAAAAAAAAKVAGTQLLTCRSQLRR